jgi:hypothetical protein
VLNRIRENSAQANQPPDKTLKEMHKKRSGQ